MRLLIVAYYFPPDGGAGTQRPASFAYHLTKLGWECAVLTKTPPSQRGHTEPEDKSLSDRVEATTEILRVGPPGGGCPAWLESVPRACAEAIARRRPDAVLLTMSPFELAKVGLEIGRRHGVPVIFDLRDPWALDGWQPQRTYLHWLRARHRMRAMLRGATGVVANTPECRKLFCELEPRLEPDRVTSITNGWEAADFAAPSVPVVPQSKLRVVYSGSFVTSKDLYHGKTGIRRATGLLRHRPERFDPSGRTPFHFLRAIKQLRDSRHPAGDDIRLVLAGKPDQWTNRCIAESGVSDAVEQLGYLDHPTSIATIRSADALFLPLHGSAVGTRSRIVPGKAYEYLATGRPILAALPEGDARDFVREAGYGYFADPCSDASIAQQLMQLHADTHAGRWQHSVRRAEADRFERGTLAAQLSDFLKRVIAQKSMPPAS